METDFPTASAGTSQAPSAAVEKSHPASHTEILTLPRGLPIGIGGMGNYVNLELRHGPAGATCRADRTALVEEVFEVSDVHRVSVPSCPCRQSYLGGATNSALNIPILRSLRSRRLVTRSASASSRARSTWVDAEPALLDASIGPSGRWVDGFTTWAMRPTVVFAKADIDEGHRWAKSGPQLGHMAWKRKSPQDGGLRKCLIALEILWLRGQDLNLRRL